MLQQSAHNGDKNNATIPTPVTVCTQEIAESTPSSVNNTVPVADRCTAGGMVDLLTPVRVVRRTKSMSLKEELELAESFHYPSFSDEEKQISGNQTSPKSVIKEDTTTTRLEETNSDDNQKSSSEEDAATFYQKNSYESSEEDAELLLGCSINSILLRNVYDLYEVSSFMKDVVVAEIIRELVLDPDCPGQKFVVRECERVGAEAVKKLNDLQQLYKEEKQRGEKLTTENESLQKQLFQRAQQQKIADDQIRQLRSDNNYRKEVLRLEQRIQDLEKEKADLSLNLDRQRDEINVIRENQSDLMTENTVLKNAAKVKT